MRTPGIDDFYDCYLRAIALEDLRKETGFEELITPFKRAVNILKQAQEKHELEKMVLFDVTLSSNPTEKKLWDTYQKTENKMREFLSQRKYPHILKEIRAMKNTVDEYFDDVLVMDKDAKIRNNHLALLDAISQFFTPVADFSKIAGEPTQ